MTLQATTQSLEPEYFIDLITISTTNINNQSVNIRICNFLRATFGGVVYEQIPCQVSGFAKNGEDTEPRATLTVGDATTTDPNSLLFSLMSTAIDENYIVGSHVNIKRTQYRFLDGQSHANSNQFFGFDMRINNYEGQYQNQFVFNLAPYYSLERKKLPSRTYSRRCQWKLNMPNEPDENCGARLDISFDLNGNSTTDPLKRACRKDLTSCKQYHGHTLRFGGFPGVARNRS